MGIIDCIYFRFQGCIRSLELRTAVEEMTLSKLEAKLYQKLALDGSMVTLKMSYCPADLGLVEQCPILDDGDARVYLRNASRKHELLVVEAISKSSVEMNYDDDAKEKAVDRTEADVKIEQGVAITEAGDEDVEIEQGVSRTEAADEDVRIEDVDRAEAVDEDVKIEDVDYNFPASQIVECSQYVDSWEDGLDVSLKQEFPNKQTLQDAIDRGAFMKSFGIAIKKSDKKRYTVNCCKEGCGWTVRGRSIGNTETFRIVKHVKLHTCSRASQSQSESKKKRRGTPSLVASVLREHRSKAVKTDTSKDIMDLVKTKLGVSVSYATAWRGRHLSVCEKYGTPEESYTSLYSYLYMLEKSNQGTTTQLELTEDGKFRFLFISLGACREGFRWMRKVIVLDATHLKNSYGGVLIFAAAQDGNRHTYPIAFGVLDGENDISWKWFMEMLKRIVPDSSELVFITDRNVSIFNAIAGVYPEAYHGFCVNHLSQNVKMHSPPNENKDVLASRFVECSRQYTLPDFERVYTAFKERYPAAARYLDGYMVGNKWKKGTCDHERWVRAKFPRERYNIDTSNYVESLNSVFKEARTYFLIPMIDYIIATISRWFDAHRVEASSGTREEKLVPFLENYMHASWAEAKKLIVTVLNTYQLEYSVTGNDGKAYLVRLLEKSCSCGFYDIEKYPCVHAIAGYIEYQRYYCVQPPKDRPREMKYDELCSNYFWTATWTLAYERTIYAVPDRSQWDVPDDVKSKIILPPDRKVKSGRKKLKRHPSAGEPRPRKRTQNVRPKRTQLSYPWWISRQPAPEEEEGSGSTPSGV